MLLIYILAYYYNSMNNNKRNSKKNNRIIYKFSNLLVVTNDKNIILSVSNNNNKKVSVGYFRDLKGFHKPILRKPVNKWVNHNRPHLNNNYKFIDNCFKCYNGSEFKKSFLLKKFMSIYGSYKIIK